MANGHEGRLHKVGNKLTWALGGSLFGAGGVLYLFFTSPEAFVSSLSIDDIRNILDIFGGYKID